MSNRWPWIAGLLLSLSITAGAAGRAPAVGLDEDFVLRIGQSVSVNGPGFIISFVAVPEDSRCPVDVTCVWAGNAQIELQVGKTESEGQTVVLNTHLEPKAAPIDGHVIQLVSLDPMPKANAPVADSEYAATLRVAGQPR